MNFREKRELFIELIREIDVALNYTECNVDKTIKRNLTQAHAKACILWQVFLMEYENEQETMRTEYLNYDS
jgi:hypothetical protein